MGQVCDFSGWATIYNKKCKDGRTIMDGAFAHMTGRVPLVDNHNHKSLGAVIGHAELEPRREGVYAYCFLNDETEGGRHAKALVNHGDVGSLSIFANGLRQVGGNVMHGDIKELSLVLAGANEGAKIDYVPNLQHSGLDFEDDPEGWDAQIDMDEPINLTNNYISHADDEEDDDDDDDEDETVADVYNGMNRKQKLAVQYMIGAAIEDSKSGAKEEKPIKHMEEEEMDDRTVQDVYDEMTEEQQLAVQYMVGAALEDAEGGSDDEMGHNLFEGYDEYDEGFDMYEDALAHADIDGYFAAVEGDMMSRGLRDSMLAHAAEYGIEDIDLLFPEAKLINGEAPEFIKRDQGWVTKVMNGVHKLPQARVKMMYADITEKEARAKGYIKGTLKRDEVITLLRREFEPTTVYKRQKFDRDDMIDITTFDKIPWVKGEMRLMLNEEFARAYIFGDGRTAVDQDKIKEDRIKPVINDHDLFVLRYAVAGSPTTSAFAKDFISSAVKARKGYKGSGSTVMLISEALVTEMILLEDTTGRRLYPTEAELAAALRVKEIIPCPLLDEGVKDKDGKDVYAVIMNFDDYGVGTDKGGELNSFEDFDINYNQMIYLLEGRCSGGLRKPFSAMVLRKGDTTGSEAPSLQDAMAPFRKPKAEADSHPNE